MNIGTRRDAGRDRDCPEAVEYCDILCLEACDMGRGNVVRRWAVVVINGGSVGSPGIGEAAASRVWGEAIEDGYADIAAVVFKSLPDDLGAYIWGKRRQNLAGELQTKMTTPYWTWVLCAVSAGGLARVDEP